MLSTRLPVGLSTRDVAHQAATSVAACVAASIALIAGTSVG